MARKKEDPARIWPPEPKRRESKLVGEFKESLHIIADRLAVHDGLKRVDDKHVDSAFETLSNAGLRRRRWVDRPESEASVGTFCIGFCFACPDVINALIGGPHDESIARFLMAISFALGVVLFFHGSYRAALPSPTQYRSPVWIWVRRIGLTLLILFLLVVIGFVLYARFFCSTCGESSDELVPTPVSSTLSYDK